MYFQATACHDLGGRDLRSFWAWVRDAVRAVRVLNWLVDLERRYGVQRVVVNGSFVTVKMEEEKRVNLRTHI